MSFFNELKRRNVFRVGIAYLVVAWLTLQVADVILNNIESPDWVFHVIMLVLAIGFPVILLFAWAFEMTPEGFKREHEVDRSQSITPETGKSLNRVIIAALIFALGYIAYDKLLVSDSQTEVVKNEDTNPEVESTAAQEQQKSIAVLPLANRSALEGDQYFTDGIHDDLLTQLAKIASLKVISRTSVMRYRDTELPIPEIAKQLGVSTILEGGIQRSGNQIRINVQLIDAETDKHLWAETYDRQMTADNLFAIQSEITLKITEALKATLTPEEVARIEDQPTQNLEALQEHMKGQQLLALRTVNGIEEGKVHFEAAIHFDPGFSQAIVGLANAYHLLHEYAGLPEAESLDLAMELVNQALELTPNLGEAYMVRGELYRHRDEQDLSEADFERAMELIPGNASVYHWYSFLKEAQDKEDEADTLLRRAHQLNPMSAVIHLNIAQMPFYKGRDEETLNELERIKQLHPGFSTSWAIESWVHTIHGDTVASLRASLKVLELDPGSTRAGFHCFEYFSLNAMESTKNCMTDYEGPLTMSRVLLKVLFLLHEDDREAALALLDSTKDLERGDHLRAVAATAAGNYEMAKHHFEQAYPQWFESGSPVTVSSDDLEDGINSAMFFASSGRINQSTALLKAALESMQPLQRNRGAYAFGYSDVQAYALLGLKEPALAALEECAELGYLSGWKGLNFLPHYDSIRDDPRFTAAVSRLSAAAGAAQDKAISEGLL